MPQVFYSKTFFFSDELVMVLDFKENRKAAYAEVKSAHFGKNQISPLSGAFLEVWQSESIILSEDTCHDHHAVKSFTIQVLDLLKKKKTSFSKVTIWSDGAASQYKVNYNSARFQLNST